MRTFIYTGTLLALFSCNNQTEKVLNWHNQLVDAQSSGDSCMMRLGQLVEERKLDTLQLELPKTLSYMEEKKKFVDSMPVEEGGEKFIHYSRLLFSSYISYLQKDIPSYISASNLNDLSQASADSLVSSMNKSIQHQNELKDSMLAAQKQVLEKYELEKL
ncbi:MAG: hypothetical protein MUF42_04715 [Cytophagaceae bacterium]|nr:hypothetical protein [Cytophagaceae bacterium]